MFIENGKIRVVKHYQKLLICIFITIIYYHQLLFNNNNGYDLIIPSSYSEIKVFLRHMKYYKRFLNYSNIVLIGPSSITGVLFNDTSISIINEDSLVKKQKINEFLWKKRAVKTWRDSWYEQQFLKMAYSRICQKEYYLVWDTDTIPIKPIKNFEKDHPIFDLKTEHNIPYFNTMERLIPGLKFINKSYISEHMMIKTEIMRNLLDSIEMNDKLSGNFFWEKILMAIDIKDLNKSGFSEYETYGTYAHTKNPNFYYHRNWFSQREAKTFFGSTENLSEDDINWLSQYYHALSFEKRSVFNEKNLEIVKDRKLQQLYKPNFFFEKYYLLAKLKQSNKTKSN